MANNAPTPNKNTDAEVFAKVCQYAPQLITILEQRLQTMLSDLPKANMDKVQLFQGRALELQEFLAELKRAAGK